MSNPRSLLIAVGTAAVGFALVLDIAAGLVGDTSAQTTTPAGEATRAAPDTCEAKAQAYDAFVAALATELGVDAAEVDATIRAALKQQVDAQEAAGELSVEQAATMKEVVDDSESPLMLVGHRGGWGSGGADGHVKGRGRGGRVGDCPG